MIKLKISIVLILAIILIGFYSISTIFAQTQISANSQLDNLVKSGIQEQKNNPQALELERQVTAGEIQTAGESKDTKEIKVPEINVEKEVESENNSSSSIDKTSTDNKSKSSSSGN